MDVTIAVEKKDVVGDVVVENVVGGKIVAENGLLLLFRTCPRLAFVCWYMKS